MMSSKIVPDLTCHSSKPTCVHPPPPSPPLQTACMSSSYSYSGLGILGWTHFPLYSGLSIIGASHSPSSSSSQSSGRTASGSGISALTSSGSGISLASTQSSGLDSSGSLISLGGRKSNSSSSEPFRTDLSSTNTSNVLSGLSTSVYR